LINRKKRQKLREEHKELEQAFNLDNTKDFWSKMKSNDNKRKALSDIPAVDTWPGYLENLEGECIELSKEN
jgi:hypothetical protein